MRQEAQEGNDDLQKQVTNVTRSMREVIAIQRHQAGQLHDVEEGLRTLEARLTDQAQEAEQKEEEVNKRSSHYRISPANLYWHYDVCTGALDLESMIWGRRLRGSMDSYFNYTRFCVPSTSLQCKTPMCSGDVSFCLRSLRVTFG